MEYYDVKFIGSAAEHSQWPDSSDPEFVFTGRSNAGKSTLINTLLNRKNIAYSGKTPGKTQLLNFYRINEEVMFVDAPGYGYSSGGHQQAYRFGRIMEPYFQKRKQLKALVLVLDIRRVPNEDDMQMIQYARKAHIAVLCICSKADKVGQSERAKQLTVISETTGIPKASLLPYSSVTKKGITEIWSAIGRIMQQEAVTSETE